MHRRLFTKSAVGAVVAVALTAAACASSDGQTLQTTNSTIGTTAAPSSAAVTITSDTLTTTTSSSSSTSTSTTSTLSTTSTTTTTLPIPDEPGPLDLTQDVVGLGRSVEGRPIVAERYGTPGGRPVLIVGVIHGDEPAGVEIVEELRSRTVPDGIELWLVESMNPDGLLANDRHNANDVDLNRNFPFNWGPIGEPGDGQYAGPGPASEPETQVMTNFIGQLRPDITIWYHQDLFLVIPSSGRDGELRARYAELTGLPLAPITGGGGIYTGIAATWARNALTEDDAVAFIVELGPELADGEAALHADAVLTIAAES